jgi:hypothetical protein
MVRLSLANETTAPCIPSKLPRMKDVDAGPLTTTFTPPPACRSPLFSVHSLSGSSFFIAGPADPTGPCFPSGYAGLISQYFSPGVCPVGYTTACQSLVSVGAATETVATCCPTAYTCDTATPDLSAALEGDGVFACKSVFAQITNSRAWTPMATRRIPRWFRRCLALAMRLMHLGCSDSRPLLQGCLPSFNRPSIAVLVLFS